MPQIIFQTQRLICRQLDYSDAAFIIKLLNSPGWLQYIGDRNVHTMAQAAQYLDQGPLASYAANGFGLWLVQKQDDDQAIGMCGLLKRADLGYALLPEYFGQGYAYEMAQSTVDYAKNVFDMNRLWAITDRANHSSMALLTKLGFQYKEIRHLYQKDLNLFELNL